MSYVVALAREWQSLIAGALGLAAGIIAYRGAIKAARLQVAALKDQVATLKDQIEDARAERRLTDERRLSVSNGQSRPRERG